MAVASASNRAASTRSRLASRCCHTAAGPGRYSGGIRPAHATSHHAPSTVSTESALHCQRAGSAITALSLLEQPGQHLLALLYECRIRLDSPDWLAGRVTLA